MERHKKIHTCIVCGYSTEYTTSMKRHLERILPCGGATRDHPDYVMMADRYIGSNRSIDSIDSIDSLISHDKDFKCDKCEHVFKHKTSYYRHKKVCKGRVNMDDRIRSLEEEFCAWKAVHSRLDSKTSITVNNNYNTSITNNILINTFGNESFNTVRQDMALLDQFYKRRGKGHVELIEYTYFRIPENRNVKTSKRRGQLRVLNEEEVWEYMDEEDVKDTMIFKSHEVLSDHFEAHKDRLQNEMSPTWYRDAQEYLQRIEEGKIDKDVCFEQLLAIRNKINELFIKYKTLMN